MNIIKYVLDVAHRAVKDLKKQADEPKSKMFSHIYLTMSKILKDLFKQNAIIH